MYMFYKCCWVFFFQMYFAASVIASTLLVILLRRDHGYDFSQEKKKEDKGLHICWEVSGSECKEALPQI